MSGGAVGGQGHNRKIGMVLVPSVPLLYIHLTSPIPRHTWAGKPDRSESASVCISLHQSASVCISLHHSASVCVRLHLSASVRKSASVCISLHQSVPVCISLHQSASVCISLQQSAAVSRSPAQSASVCIGLHQSASVCISLNSMIKRSSQTGGRSFAGHQHSYRYLHRRTHTLSRSVSSLPFRIPQHGWSKRKKG